MRNRGAGVSGMSEEECVSSWVFKTCWTQRIKYYSIFLWFLSFDSRESLGFISGLSLIFFKLTL